MDATATVIPEGTICIDGDRIAHLGPRNQAVPAAFSSVPRINVNGTIYPGLMELHNHPSYNAIPLWDVPARFVNRKGWRGDKPNGLRPHPLYTRRVSNPSTLLTHDPSSDNARAVIRFVECRALLGGVTTTQDLTLYNMPDGTKAAYAGLVRNVELPDDSTWPTAEDQINDFTSVKEANDKYGPLSGNSQRPYIMHLSEGTDQSAHDAFAIRYALSRWEGLTRFLHDGRIELDTNPVERAIRPVALGRKNHLFAGSDGGGERWAIICSLIETGASTSG